LKKIENGKKWDREKIGMVANSRQMINKKIK
jgi:hypothetical protein